MILVNFMKLLGKSEIEIKQHWVYLIQCKLGVSVIILIKIQKASLCCGPDSQDRNEKFWNYCWGFNENNLNCTLTFFSVNLFYNFLLSLAVNPKYKHMHCIHPSTCVFPTASHKSRNGPFHNQLHLPDIWCHLSHNALGTFPMDCTFSRTILACQIQSRHYQSNRWRRWRYGWTSLTLMSANGMDHHWGISKCAPLTSLFD